VGKVFVSNITFIKGNKHPKDKIILYKGHPITFMDWIQLGIEFYKNENNIYDKPWHKGGEMIKECMLKGWKHLEITKEMIREYKLNG
jgi:hypothetical protein